MNFILVVFTCAIINGNYDSCPVEATIHQEITFEQCEIERIKLQPKLNENQVAVCVEIDFE